MNQFKLIKLMPPALLALVLAACAVGPDYQRPQTALPSAYAEAKDNAEALKSEVLDAEWWKLFGDETLDQLVATALTNNHDLLTAVARIDEAEGAAREAGAALWPQVNAQAGGNRNKISAVSTSSAPGMNRYVDDRSAGLSTAFEIDVWGKLRRANEAAKAQMLASAYARDTVALSVSSLVAVNYLALRAYDAGVQVSQESLSSREESLRIVQSRLKGGLTSALDLYQAEGALAVAQTQLTSLRQQRALMQNQLALLTAQPNLSIPVGDLRQLPLPPVPPAGLPSALLEARPDLRQAEETLIAANARIGVAKAALFPSLSLTGTLGSASANLSNLFTSAASTWGIGLTSLMPIFDMGKNSARIDQASAQQQQALFAYQKTVHTAFKEVMDALVNLRETQASETAQKTRVSTGAKALQLAQTRYKSGYSPYADVLEAQRSSNDALLAYVDTRQLRLSASVALFKALGGGWQASKIAPAPVLNEGQQY